jgi:cobalt/nickel transport system ATP-binding protein
MSQTLYRLDKLSHQYSSGLALDGITAEIAAGGCMGLVGCNGAGKSTLIYILAALLDPMQGVLEWNGQAVSAGIFARDPQLRAAFRRNVGIVFQDPDTQWLCDSVKSEVIYGPAQIWASEEAELRALEAMQTTGVSHLAEQAPYALSGGEKRRVALASVIAMDPDVLLLDEPTASLDAATTDFLLDWLDDFAARPGKTIIMATHDLHILREVSERCMVLTPCHRLAAFDSTDAILSDTSLLRQMNLQGRRKPGIPK